MGMGTRRQGGQGDKGTRGTRGQGGQFFPPIPPSPHPPITHYPLPVPSYNLYRLTTNK
ncbi:MAG: hypothetical protein KME31_06185 [Tolypothrix carrinoi HA7290-LM1]|nr:hypothetical protein [Tolypothrix carrinoi HA7290-LM1]